MYVNWTIDGIDFVPYMEVMPLVGNVESRLEDWCKDNGAVLATWNAKQRYAPDYFEAVMVAKAAGATKIIMVGYFSDKDEWTPKSIPI